MARGDINISNYEPPVYELIAGPEPQPLQEPLILKVRRRWKASVVAGAATVALHLVFLTSVEWGLGAARLKNVTPPKTMVPGGRVGDDGFAMEWILIEDQPSQRGSGTPRPIEDLESRLPPVTLDQKPVPQTVVEGEEAQAQANAAAAQAGSSDLYGLYVHQIYARIERAWLRPRTPIGARKFSCSARIEQDEAGRVLDVRLRGCKGDARWRQSLVDAVRSAVPLPFPPDPKVFRRVITLSFQAQAYTSGSEPGLYEPEIAEPGRKQ